MILTYIARVTDGLLLVASLTDSGDIGQLKTDGKRILQELNHASELQCTIKSGNFNFHYIIEQSIVYLTLTTLDYPKKSVFLYLSDLHRSFAKFLSASYGQNWINEVNTFDRPYVCVKFDTEIKKIMKKYSKGQSSNGDMSSINSELLEVQNIMKKNIEDVLGRGDRLQKAAETSSNLVFESKRFSSKAKKLNWMQLYKTYGPLVAVTFIIVLLLYFRFFF